MVLGPLQVIAVAQQQPAGGLDHAAGLLVVAHPVGVIDTDTVDDAMAVLGDDMEEVVDDLRLWAAIADLVGIGLLPAWMTPG